MRNWVNFHLLQLYMRWIRIRLRICDYIVFWYMVYGVWCIHGAMSQFILSIRIFNPRNNFAHELMFWIRFEWNILTACTMHSYTMRTGVNDYSRQETLKQFSLSLSLSFTHIHTHTNPTTISNHEFTYCTLWFYISISIYLFIIHLIQFNPTNLRSIQFQRNWNANPTIGLIHHFWCNNMLYFAHKLISSQ